LTISVRFSDTTYHSTAGKVGNALVQRSILK
jgi:hypothetical protein